MKEKLCVIFFIAIVGFPVISYAQKTFEFTTLCQQAYREIMQLKLETGNNLIEQAENQNPDNLVPIVLDSYSAFLKLFFNESAEEYQSFIRQFDANIALIKQGTKSSPLYNYSLGVLYLHRAVAHLKFEKQGKGAWDFQTAYKYLKQNKKNFPTFLPNQLYFGTLQAAASTIPKGYQWIANILGIRGNMQEGMRMVQQFINSNDPWAKLFSAEANFIYGYLLFYIENKKADALDYIKNRKLDVVNNHLFTFMAANLGINDKQTEYAKSVLLNRNKSAAYYPTPIWDFQLGQAYLYHLQYKESIYHFNRFLQQFKGQFYLKDTYLKLAYAYYLQGNTAAAEQARKNVLSKGSQYAEADKYAYKLAKEADFSNPILLKARLLNDGGYNKEALQILQSKTIEEMENTTEQLEYNYRKARIYDDMKSYAEAIPFYVKTIEAGEHNTAYYAARAALQLGNIYEKKQDCNNAIYYYQKCLDMENHDYKNSIDQKAKSGLLRCKK